MIFENAKLPVCRFHIRKGRRMGPDGIEGKGEEREGGKDRMRRREGKREEREGKERKGIVVSSACIQQIPMFFS